MQSCIIGAMILLRVVQIYFSQSSKSLHHAVIHGGYMNSKWHALPIEN
jgi:hypothetical protein